jgi:hypothetical protein
MMSFLGLVKSAGVPVRAGGYAFLVLELDAHAQIHTLTVNTYSLRLKSQNLIFVKLFIPICEDNFANKIIGYTILHSF